MAIETELKIDIVEQKNPGVFSLSLEGILDIYSAQRLKKILEEATADPAILSVLIDANKLEMIDSSGIGVVLVTSVKMKKKGGALRLIKPQEFVLSALEITRSLSMISVHESVEDALSAPP